jgi:uncharacterized protein (DUF58 family)
MLNRPGALLASAGFALAVVGAGLERPVLLLLGVVSLLYLGWVAVGLALPGAVLHSDSVRVECELKGLREGGSVLLGRVFTVKTTARNASPFGLAHLSLTDTVPRNLSVVDERGMSPARAPGGTLSLAPRSSGSYHYEVSADIVGPATFGGVHAELSDSLRLMYYERFFPTLSRVDVLPLPAGLGQAVARGAPSRYMGRQRLAQKGLGSDLHDIRPYVAGDSMRKIAWKAVARTGRLLTRETEAEVTVPLTLLVDSSESMRSGRFGHTKLDYVVRVAAVVAASASQAQNPCGLGVFSERRCRYVAPRLGKNHLTRLLRELAAAKEPPMEEQLPLATISLIIQGYLHGLDPGYVAAPTEEWQPSAVYSWVAEEYSLAAEERHRLATDREFARRCLLRFCRDRGIVLPARRRGRPGTPLEADSEGASARDTMLRDLLRRAVSRARERELFVVLSDLEGSSTSETLLEAFRMVRARHHGLLVLSPFTPWFETLGRDTRGGGSVTAEELAEEMFTLAFMEERQALRRAVRRLGVPVRDLAPDRMARVVLEEVARMKRDRAVRR